ncbi:MAG: hypothetical protein KKE23_00030 [Nanoarchaeota archaeon]|nr:hypothetical protein [Nanoarchaeota archaeon]
MEKINSLEDALKMINLEMDHGKLSAGNAGSVDNHLLFSYEPIREQLKDVHVLLEHEVYSKKHGVNHGFPGGAFMAREIDFDLHKISDSEYSLNISNGSHMVSAFINNRSMLDSRYNSSPAFGSSSIVIPTSEPKGYLLRIVQAGL